MKIFPVFRRTMPKRNLDKYNLRSLLSKIPTKSPDGNPMITALETPKGIISDKRALGGGLTLTIGKSRLLTDSDGKILKYNKPFYKSLNKLLKKASEMVNFANINISNEKIVKKKTTELLLFSKEKLVKLLEG